MADHGRRGRAGVAERAGPSDMPQRSHALKLEPFRQRLHEACGRSIVMTAMNELHVVYGSGPVGTAVVEALLAQGKRVQVVTRSGARKHLPAQAEVARGDATNPTDARKVCAGATHVYNCTNPIDYHRWPEQFPPLQRGVLEGAAANGAKLIVMENLY